ncbi:unnamed protein product, partial [Phaeothamnion confervicola]
SYHESPWYVVHGHETCVPLALILGWQSQEPVLTATEHGQLLEEVLPRAYELVRRNLGQLRADRSLANAALKGVPEFVEGDMVYLDVRCPPPAGLAAGALTSRKVNRPWNGPWKVLTRVGP